jgi:hypothetical protein
MQYPNSGKLSHNKYKESGDKKPDMVGDIIMERSVLKQLLDEQGDEITIKLSAWKMEGNYGPWMRISWNNYKPKTEGQPIQQKPEQASIPLDDSDVPF